MNWFASQTPGWTPAGASRMDRRRVLRRIVTPAVIGVALLVAGCSNPEEPEGGDAVTPADSPQLPARGFYMGFLPVPGDGQDFDTVYPQAAEYAEFVPIWGRGDGSGFWGFAEDLGGWWGDVFVDQLTRANDMFPLLHFSFMDRGEGGTLALKTPADMQGATLSDTAWRDLYEQAILEGVRMTRPLYLSLGNEVNRWFEQYGTEAGDPNGFQHFVSLYEDIYDAAKKLSPQTYVFCVFAREIVGELREADLAVLELLDPARLDLLVLTSYPYSVRTDAGGSILPDPFDLPSDIPDDYYTVAADRIPGKRFGFSELGWSSLEAFGGEQGQADLVTHAAGRLTRDRGMDLHLFGWAWLHDIDENDHTGLIRRDGTEKLAYAAWKELSASNG